MTEAFFVEEFVEDSMLRGQIQNGERNAFQKKMERYYFQNQVKVIFLDEGEALEADLFNEFEDSVE